MTMNTTSATAGLLQNIIEHPTRGVVGIVDDMLRLCHEHGLDLHWQLDRCRIRSAGNGAEEVVEKPLGKSAFRALLARVAALCNERGVKPFSPYGGQCDLLLGEDAGAALHISFANTPEQQWLKVEKLSRLTR